MASARERSRSPRGSVAEHGSGSIIARSLNLDKMELALDDKVVKVYRFADDPDMPWFQAKPLVVYLGYANVAQTLEDHVDREDKMPLQELVGIKGTPLGGGISQIPPLGYNDSKAMYISECGMYSLILGSKKKEAKDFKRWITHEVLPALRRRGHYTAPGAAAAPSPIAPEQLQQIVVALRQDLIKCNEDSTSRQEEMHRRFIESVQTVVVDQINSIEEAQRRHIMQHVQNFKDWLVQEWKTKICSELSASVCFSLSQKFVDLRSALRDAVSNPTGVFVEALRRAVKKPAVKRSTDVLRFPDEQRATPEEERFVESLSVTLTKMLEAFDREKSLHTGRPLPALTYGAWKKTRSLIGSRCLALRKKTGDASKPLLWTTSADAGARSNGGGQHYVYLAEGRASIGGHAATYVRKVLNQKLKKTNNSLTVEEHIRALISATPPETWPLSSSSIDAFAHNASEEKLAEEMDE